MKFNKNRLKSLGDMKWTRNARVNPLTLSLSSWAMCSAHRLTERNIKIVQRVQKIWRGQESIIDRMTNGLTDEGHSYKPHSALHWGLNMNTHTSCFRSLIKEIHMFEILKWTR